MFKLRPYQQQAIDNIKKRLVAWVRRQLLVMATGLWKTVVFAQFPEIAKKQGKKTLILAHRWELLQQAAEKIHKISPHLVIQIEKGSEKANPQADVIVASVPTLWREGSDRIKKFDPKDFWIIIIDEAHHATAQGYLNILDYFWADKNWENYKEDHPLVLWVTATPNRTDNIWLDNVFDEVVFKHDIKDGISEGFLAPIKAYSIFTGTSLDKVKTRAWDFATGELSNAVNTEYRNKLVVETYRELSDWEKAIIFCVDVQHTKDMAELFASEWYNTGYVIWDMSKEEREDIIEDFKNWDVQVMCNCMTLTEWFDAPEIRTVLFARPTKSNSLYLQMWWRWTRIAPWKDHVKFVDFVDNLSKHKVVTSSTIIWLDQPIKAKGENLLELWSKFEEIINANPFEDLSKLEIEDLDKRIQEVDIFKHAKLSDFIKNNSSYSWTKYFEGYKLGLGYNDVSEPINVEIRENAIGKFTITFTHGTIQKPNFHNGFKKYGREVIHEMQWDDIVDAIQKADKRIYEKYRDKVSLVDQWARRRKDPPSEKQIALLKRHGYHNAWELSKGEACNLISKIFADKERKRGLKK